MSYTPAFSKELLALGLSDALPTLVSCHNVTTMQFNVMKLLPAFSTIEGARRRGRLQTGQPVIESSSGSFAYGLARVCSALRHPLTIVSADLEPWLEEALTHLGATVDLVDAAGDLKRVQRLRLERLEALRRTSGAYWPCQYHNPDNARGYVAAAEMLVQQIGIPDVMVCPVGSGGNSAGLIQVLRKLSPSIRLVGVDCFGSVTFGQPLADRELGGIGNSLMPRCVDHRAFDEIHWVGADVAIAGARRISGDGLGDFGLTSGAAYMAGTWIASTRPSARIVAVFPDRAFRYAERLATAPSMPADRYKPTTVEHPSQAVLPWARLEWSRRSLAHWRQGTAYMSPTGR